MAAVDPTDEPEPDEDGNIPEVARSTLRIVKQKLGDLEDDDSDDEEYMKALLANGLDDEDSEGDESSDDEPNGGPSDPAKSKKARQEAAIKQLLEATQGDDSDEDMEGEDDETKPNGVKPKNKGKEPATNEDDEDEDDEDSDDDSSMDLENFVVCTLDTERNYQQPLDLTINEDERVFFVVTGTHPIHVTGNYYVDYDDSDSEDDDEYDLPPDMEDLIGDEDISSDELDEVEYMERIKEIDTDEEEAPKLVETKKGKKRPAEDEEMDGLDDMIAKESKADEPKLSKKQLKKMKNNKGEPVAVQDDTKSAIKEVLTPKSDKKVQFAKNLEQGPTGSAEKAKQGKTEAEKKDKQDADKKASLGKKVVHGVTIDDRKLGTGRQVKSGDTVSLRYIGKLESNNKVFDSNKKGAPFKFRVGKGEVIKGWDTGIVGMSVGGERRLVIPPNLAYGSKKLDGIPANSTLVFDVKLLEIK